MATIDMAKKRWSGGCYARFAGERAGSPSNKIPPGPMSNSVPSGILIHPARLATIDMGRKLGGLCTFLFGGS